MAKKGKKARAMDKASPLTAAALVKKLRETTGEGTNEEICARALEAIVRQGIVVVVSCVPRLGDGATSVDVVWGKAAIGDVLAALRSGQAVAEAKYRERLAEAERRLAEAASPPEPPA